MLRQNTFARVRREIENRVKYSIKSNWLFFLVYSAAILNFYDGRPVLIYRWPIDNGWDCEERFLSTYTVKEYSIFHTWFFAEMWAFQVIRKYWWTLQKKIMKQLIYHNTIYLLTTWKHTSLYLIKLVETAEIERWVCSSEFVSISFSVILYHIFVILLLSTDQNLSNGTLSTLCSCGVEVPTLNTRTDTHS